MGETARILVIEDEVNAADFLKRGLTQKGFDTRVSLTGLQGLEAAKSTKPDLVVLDLILPDVDGIDVCRELRSWGDVGIIILTARHVVGDRVLGLEVGADDYLPKPFAFEELVARIRAVLRRKNFMAEKTIVVGDLKIDVQRRQVQRGGRPVHLTYREFELLKVLAEHAGRPVRHDVILQRVWGDKFETEVDPVKVYISFIRRKLNSGGDEDLIRALRGYGYVLEARG